MSEPTVLDFYAGWEQHNELLVKSISPLSEEQLLWSPGDGFWSIRMLACHIVATRAWWFHGWMGEGDDELERLTTMDDDSDVMKPEAATICAALDKSWSDVAAGLRRWTAEDLTTKFQRPASPPRPDGTRPWRDRRFIIWHVAEHDVHHGGEISLILGTHGATGFDM